MRTTSGREKRRIYSLQAVSLGRRGLGREEGRGKSQGKSRLDSIIRRPYSALNPLINPLYVKPSGPPKHPQICQSQSRRSRSATNIPKRDPRSPVTFSGVFLSLLRPAALVSARPPEIYLTGQPAFRYAYLTPHKPWAQAAAAMVISSAARCALPATQERQYTLTVIRKFPWK